MAGRRLQLARTLMAVGAHRVVGRLGSASLLVVNYHRLHARADHGPTRLRRRGVRYRRRYFPSPDAVAESVDGRAGRRRVAAPGRRMANCRAVPCIRPSRSMTATSIASIWPSRCWTTLGIRGIFFIPFEMLETRRLGWWDVAAYLLKSTTHRCSAGRWRDATTCTVTSPAPCDAS